MKTTTLRKIPSNSETSVSARSKHEGGRSRHVASAACLALALITVGPSVFLNAQTQAPPQSQPQTAQPEESPKATSPDFPNPNAPESAKPAAAEMPVVKTSITVTDSIATSSPANISVVSNENLEAIPGVSLDDQLRIIPGFSLLRRTSGVVASATTQGVSLRGLGLAGPSRTLVLWDGIPLNDPFGGWVNWVRISPDDVAEVNVVRGATTSVFGDLAMAGAVSIFSRPAEKNLVDLSQEGGSQGTLQTHGTYSWLGTNLGFSIDTRLFATDGYYVVPGVLRGPIDTHAYNRFVAGAPRLDWFQGENRFSLKFDDFAEHRSLGTTVTGESTTFGELSGHYSREMKNDIFSIAGYFEDEDFSSRYSSILPGRSVETLVDLQYVPVKGAGGAAYWQHYQSRWHITGGGDVEYVTGFSHDYNTFAHMTAVTGGDIVQHGLFGQADYTAGPFQFFGGIRYQFTDAHNNIAAPNGGITYTRGILRIRGSLNRSFRVPTLTELYRPYRMGNILTLPNSALVPETMNGGEVGFDLRGKSRSLSVTGFRNSLTDFIEQINISENPTLITRQRANAGNGINEGVEIDVEQRWGRFLGSLGYLYADTHLTSGALAGLWAPGVPRHQGTAQLTYLYHGTLISAALRSYSYQFDDQNNQFLDPGYAVLQFAASQHLWRQLSATFGMENALDRYYVVAHNPVVNQGEPRVFRVGMRWNGKAGH